jgi:PIN domain nuclease of toxin-antitoxin system
MELFLDTCTFIWWDSGGGSLSPAAPAALQAPANRLYLSLASLWELQLKHQRGKLLLRKPLPEIVSEQCQQNGLGLLAIEPTDIYALSQLPFHHADPFDRLIHFASAAARLLAGHGRPGVHKVRRAGRVVMTGVGHPEPLRRTVDTFTTALPEGISRLRRSFGWSRMRAFARSR